MEQPLPPYGACLLGSFNLAKYVYWDKYHNEWSFNYDLLKNDIRPVVQAMDNVIDRTIYPLEAQKQEALSKRRMGLGVTGVANAGEALGFEYGSAAFIEWLEDVMAIIRDTCYRSSISLALEKGPFPLFKADLYLESDFAKTLPEDIRRDIHNYGIRNSHLLSVAPTGTISLSADNVSSGIEPVFSHFYDRTIQTFDGPKVERVEDYGYRVFKVKGKTANELSVFDHVKVLNAASKYVDSACSKTCNVGDEVTWDEFKQVYMNAYLGGASGCTTFRASGKRYGILNASAVEDIAEEVAPEPEDFLEESGACYYDPSTGLRKCE
jgi:ribonucleoside-diphosphate reductase alpha chain